MGHSEHKDSSGHSIPSVSQIPAIFAQDLRGFEDWICRQEHVKEERCCTRAKRKYYEEQANLGNDIHALREAFLQGEAFSKGVPEYQAAVFGPVAKFYIESGYKPLYIEQKMTGKEFGGSCDGFGTFTIPFWEAARKTIYDKRTRDALDKKLIIPPSVSDIICDDLKIKSKLNLLHPLQLLGYSKLLKEVYEITCNWGLIIRREKKLETKPELQLRLYYLPLFESEWQASFLMWRFLNC